MPAHTRVQAKHRRTTEDDIRGFHKHLSIQPFTIRFFGHGTFGWTAIQVHEKIVTRQLQTMFQIDLQCKRSLQICNDLAPMSGCRRVRRGWRRLRSTGSSSRWRGGIALWGISEWLTWFVLQVSYFAAAHIHPQGQTCTMHSISWSSLTVNNLLNWHQDECNHKFTLVHPFLASHGFSWLTPPDHGDTRELVCKLHQFERWNLKAWTLILW